MARSSVHAVLMLVFVTSGGAVRDNVQPEAQTICDCADRMGRHAPTMNHPQGQDMCWDKRNAAVLVAGTWFQRAKCQSYQAAECMAHGNYCALIGPHRRYPATHPPPPPAAPVVLPTGQGGQGGQASSASEADWWPYFTKCHASSVWFTHRGQTCKDLSQRGNVTVCASCNGVFNACLREMKGEVSAPQPIQGASCQKNPYGPAPAQNVVTPQAVTSLIANLERLWTAGDFLLEFGLKSTSGSAWSHIFHFEKKGDHARLYQSWAGTFTLNFWMGDKTENKKHGDKGAQICAEYQGEYNYAGKKAGLEAAQANWGGHHDWTKADVMDFFSRMSPSHPEATISPLDHRIELPVKKYLGLGIAFSKDSTPGMCAQFVVSGR